MIVLETMNRDAIDDDGVLSDSSNDRESNAIASDLYATENCALLLQNNEKSNDIIVLRRIAHYTDGGSRFKTKFQDDDYDNDDGNQQQNSRFERQSRRKSLKRFLFLFGFASMLIILSQLYLLFYYDDPSVQGVFVNSAFYFNYNFLSYFIFFNKKLCNLSGWEKNRTRRTLVYILPNNKTTILEPTTLCRSETPILLLIVVFSAPQNFEHR